MKKDILYAFVYILRWTVFVVAGLFFRKSPYIKIVKARVDAITRSRKSVTWNGIDKDKLEVKDGRIQLKPVPVDYDKHEVMNDGSLCPIEPAPAPVVVKVKDHRIVGRVSEGGGRPTLLPDGEYDPREFEEQAEYLRKQRQEKEALKLAKKFFGGFDSPPKKEEPVKKLSPAEFTALVMKKLKGRNSQFQA